MDSKQVIIRLLHIGEDNHSKSLLNFLISRDIKSFLPVFFLEWNDLVGDEGRLNKYEDENYILIQ